MRKKRFEEYGLDLQYEFRTYKNVGKDYGNWKSANRGLFLNVMRFCRKYIYNRKEQRYKFCNTYSEWENHVKEIIPKGIGNYNDLSHWLISERRGAELYLETIKIIIIPIYIAMLGMKNIFLVDTFSSVAYTLFIISVVSAYAVYDGVRKIEFYEDFITIVEEEIL